MKRLLITTVATIILLCSTTNITAQASSILQTRTFRTNLVKGEHVYKEVLEPEEYEPVDVVQDDAYEEIIENPEEIAEPGFQESDEHTDVSTPTDIESVVIEDTGDLDQMEEPTQSEEPDETIEEYIGETEVENEEEHETEVQGSE